MKNVKIIVKVRRLIKSFAVVFFVPLLFVAGSAFKSSPENGDPKKAASKDGSLNDKSGFKSLFSASYFDPSKPYVAQLNPKAVPFVQRYIHEQGANLEKMKIWGKPYFDMYNGILSGHNLPVELKYLSVIESSLKSNSVSVAGAVGPWQIMAEEAKRMGLRIDARQDERTNFYKSTHAAAKILKGLHRQFNERILVIAAYNCGAGRLRQAIRRSGSNNFWDLQTYLPEETRNHVKRFIGTHFIFEGNGGLTTMTSSELLDFDMNVVTAANKKRAGAEGEGIETLEVAGKYKSSVIATILRIDLSFFNKLNPHFDKLVASGKTYSMQLPSDKMSLFTKNKNMILSESLNSLLNL